MDTDTIAAGPDTSLIQRETATVQRTATELTITDTPSYTSAADFLKGIKRVRDQIGETFDPLIKSAHDHHKQLIAEKKKHDAPLDEAERVVKGKIASYQQELERRRQEEERRLQEQARKEEEERRLAQAVELEQQGEAEAASELIEATIETPPVVVAAAVPKVAGISTRKNYKFRIVDARKIPFEYMMPDEKKIGAHARSMREQARIPGVEFYSEDVVSASGF